MMPVTRFSALGFTLSNFRIHVHDLPDTLGIQGLLGLSFLRQFNYEVRSAEGRIRVDRIPREVSYVACHSLRADARRSGVQRSKNTSSLKPNSIGRAGSDETRVGKRAADHRCSPSHSAGGEGRARFGGEPETPPSDLGGVELRNSHDR